MKHLFIVNPVAGGKDHSAQLRERLDALFAGRGDSYELYVTKAPMDAVKAIRERAADGEAWRVYACGGDGTFNECVNGAALLPNVAAAPFPTGTGNDFCRRFGEEKDCFRDLEALLNGWEHPIDLIECNGRYSANICSVGIDARIGCDVHTYSKLPLIGGAAGYVVSAAVNACRGISSHMRIRCGGEELDGRFSLVCACNGRYYGGGFNPSPTARPDDGELDILAVKSVNLLRFVQLIGRYAAGRAAELPDYVRIFHGTELELSLDKPDVINVDGEAMRAAEIKMRLVPGAMKLIVPATLRFFGPAGE